MKPQSPASPHAIIMVGIPGSGKSSFAEKFADTFQAPILNRLKLQKDLELNNDQSDKLTEIILNEFVKTRRTLVIEGGLDTKDERSELIKLLTKANYRTLMVWVQTDTAEARRRAAKPYPQGSGIDSDDFDGIVKGFEAPTEKERFVVISGKHTYATQLKIILKQLATDNGITPPVKQSPHTQQRGRGIIIR